MDTEREVVRASATFPEPRMAPRPAVVADKIERLGMVGMRATLSFPSAVSF